MLLPRLTNVHDDISVALQTRGRELPRWCRAAFKCVPDNREIYPEIVGEGGGVGGVYAQINTAGKTTSGNICSSVPVD